MGFSSTRQVAAMLDVTITSLSRALWDGRVTNPEKGPGGNFLWTADDIERASWVMRGRGVADLALEQR